MKLLHLTDIHLTTPGNTIAGRDPNANFQKALDHALRHHPDAEAMFITGDLSDWGERPDYERLRAILDALPLPVHLCIGNHDDRDIFLSVFPEHGSEEGFVQRAIRLSGATAITLDSWGPESHAGHLCQARMRWLSEALARAEGPVLLFLHHNPVPTGVPVMDRIMLLDADLLARTLAPHKDKLAHIFHGHCHLNMAGSFAGIPFFAPRGTNHAGWPDFEATEVLAGADLNACYAVIRQEADSLMIHPIEYDYDGPRRPGGQPDYASWDRSAPR